MDNINPAPLPGTTLRNITDEWRILSGFHALMRQRMKLEGEHLRQLRQLQDSIDPSWFKSGVWALISPVFDLWSTQMDILQECNNVLIGVLESCPKEPSPDEPEEGVKPSSRYTPLHAQYDAYQDCHKQASSSEGIAEMQKWYHRSVLYRKFVQEPLPAIDRKYRESVVAQREALQSIAGWHIKVLPEKLEAHFRYAEETQACLRNYLVESSKFTSDLVKSISMAQKRLAEFSSLAFIDPSHKSFEDESLHPALQPAVYFNYCLEGAPAEPVLGVVSHLPRLLEAAGGITVPRHDPHGLEVVRLWQILELEKTSTSLDEVIEKLRETYSFYRWDMALLTLGTIAPLLPIGDSAVRRHRYGIKREEIPSLLKPFPIEKCRMAYAAIARACSDSSQVDDLAQLILGSNDAEYLLWDIWRKWDFENHRPLPREVIRTLPEFNDRDRWVGGGELVFRKSGQPYTAPQ